MRRSVYETPTPELQAMLADAAGRQRQKWERYEASGRQDAATLDDHMRLADLTRLYRWVLDRRERAGAEVPS